MDEYEQLPRQISRTGMILFIAFSALVIAMLSLVAVQPLKTPCKEFITLNKEVSNEVCPE